MQKIIVLITVQTMFDIFWNRLRRILSSEKSLCHVQPPFAMYEIVMMTLFVRYLVNSFVERL